MASASSNTAAYGCDPTSPDTTFIQADPYTFRTIVQKLTGAPDDPSTQKFPLTHPNRPLPILGPKRPPFKLHERRQSTKNLQINLNNRFEFDHPDQLFQFRHQRGFLVSPVSTLDFQTARMSPRSAREEEDRAIAEKGFYLQPSPSSTPRGAEPPELLPRFPVRSPSDIDDDRSSCS